MSKRRRPPPFRRGPKVVKKTPAERKAYTAEFVQPNWYQFCVTRYGECDSRGLKTAGQMWWSMRYWADKRDDGFNPKDLTTESGFAEEHGGYWVFKMESVPHMFDWQPKKAD